MTSTGMITTLAAQVPGFTPGPGWNLIADVQDMLSFAFMRNAFAAGTASARYSAWPCSAWPPAGPWACSASGCAGGMS